MFAKGIYLLKSSKSFNNIYYNLLSSLLAEGEGLEPPKAIKPRQFSRLLPHPAGLPAYMARQEGFEPSDGLPRRILSRDLV